MPGVSEKTIWKSSPLTMPRMRWRVVCALEVMMESFSPTNAFISVDFPTLGFPMILTKPDLCMKCGLLGFKVTINSRKFLMFAKVTRLNRIAYGEITGIYPAAGVLFCGSRGRTVESNRFSCAATARKAPAQNI